MLSDTCLLSWRPVFVVLPKAVFHVEQMLQGFCGRKADSKAHIVCMGEMQNKSKQQYLMAWDVNELVVNVQIHADWTVS